MKIETNTPNHPVRELGAVAVGRAFTYGGVVFIKTNEKNLEGRSVCVNLETGNVRGFGRIDEVLLVPIKVVVG